MDEMDLYAPNSHKSKEERAMNPPPERKPEKVISGSAKPKKKSEIQKFAEIFISEDAGNLKSYILMDVLVPTIKKAISEIITNGIDMILYGESGKTRKGNTATKVSYGKFYDRDDSVNRRSDNRPSLRGYDYDDIMFESRGDAEAVLDAMNDIISQYGVVSVGDLYDLADISTNNYNTNKYGWSDISGSKVVRVRDGYMLKLPKALPLI